jgi:hypothetical protein
VEKTNNMIKLHIGCGFDKKKDFLNVDSSKEVNPDLVCDLDTQELPLQKDSVGFVLMDNVFEHFTQPVKVLEKLYEVSCNGAVWTIIVPFGYSWNDVLFHKTQGFHWNTFDHFLVGNKRPYYTKVRLKLLSATGVSDGLLRWLPFKRKLSSLCNNVYREIVYELEVVK